MWSSPSPRTGPSDGIIIGRDRELSRLAALVAAPAAGAADALLLVGEAGAGKTALVDAAVARAGDARPLRARGYEGESGLAFAGLTQLVRPLLGHLDEIPAAQAAALRAALALGPPVVMDRFAAYAGLVALLTTAARRTPLLVVVDDAHWLDVPSAEALGFCARRLEDDAVALLLAARREEGEWLGRLGVPELVVGPLAPADAQILLTSRAPDLVARVRERLLALADGNALALVELPAVLDEAQRRGEASLPDPLLPGGAVAAAFGRRLEALDEAARRAVALAAVSQDARRAPVEAAAARLGVGEGLRIAAASGLLEIDDEQVLLRHPLLRGAVLTTLSAGEIRRAHRALAELLVAPGEVEARAWHLAHAAVGPDDEAAAALEAAAGLAASRTAYAAAAGAMERAGILSGTRAAQAARLFGAAQLTQAAGRTGHAIALLDRAAEATDDPDLSLRIGHARGLAGMTAEPTDEAFARFVAVGERASGRDPALASQMLADAVLTRTMAGDCRQALGVARRALALSRAQAGPPGVSVTANVMAAFLLAGRVRDALPLSRALDAAIESIDPLSPEGYMLVIATAANSWTGRLRIASARLSAWLERARDAGGLTFLGHALPYRAEVHFRIGAWDRARADAFEAIEILEENGQLVPAGYALTTLAHIAAAEGRRDEAEAACRRATEVAARFEAGAVFSYAAAARGLGALGDGDPEGAVEILLPYVVRLEREGLRNPVVVMWQPDLVEALVRLGRITEARRALATLAEQAYATDGRWARAVTSRCRGMIDPDLDRHFREALALHDGLEMPFEEARTRLVYGERLRRARRHAEARGQLEAALAVFERLGARPWADRAGEELEALGVTRRGAGPERDRLTPRELQVALAVADGLSNREVAARLFISEKTVERHLSALFGKLGVRSRTELANRITQGPGGAPTR